MKSVAKRILLALTFGMLTVALPLNTTSTTQSFSGDCDIRVWRFTDRDCKETEVHGDVEDGKCKDLSEYPPFRSWYYIYLQARGGDEPGRFGICSLYVYPEAKCMGHGVSTGPIDKGLGWCSLADDYNMSGKSVQLICMK